MGSICTVPVVDSEFWAVVLADPDLLDEAFAEVLGFVGRSATLSASRYAYGQPSSRQPCANKKTDRLLAASLAVDGRSCSSTTSRPVTPAP